MMLIIKLTALMLLLESVGLSILLLGGWIISVADGEGLNFFTMEIQPIRASYWILCCLAHVFISGLSLVRTSSIEARLHLSAGPLWAFEVPVPFVKTLAVGLILTPVLLGGFYLVRMML